MGAEREIKRELWILDRFPFLKLSGELLQHASKSHWREYLLAHRFVINNWLDVEPVKA
jgi:hypothetical protein